MILATVGMPLFANTVATITALKGNVKIQNERITQAILGEKLQEKDSVITAQKSKVQIVFKDETVVTIGKNSHFSIQKYIDSATNPVVEFQLLQGAMRTITGKIGKIAPNKFKVHTRTATIGIRGTNFIVLADGINLKAYCTYGAISVTYQNRTVVVQQGFFASLLETGAIQVEKFSAKDLVALEKKHFAVKEILNYKKSSNIKSEAMVDTKKENTNVRIVTLSDDVKDAVATSSSEGQKPKVYLSGYSTDNDYETDMNAKAHLLFQADGSHFNRESSYVEVIKKSNDEYTFDNWTLYLKDKPSSFHSQDDFITSFAMVKLEAGQGSTAHNPVIVTSTFKTFDDDSAGDYMSWGKWNAVVTYEYDGYSDYPYSERTETTTTQQGRQEFKGLWIAGQATASSVIQARNDSESYLGSYKVMDIDSGTIDKGLASLHVDFAEDRVITNLEPSENKLLPQGCQFDGMKIKDNGFTTEIKEQTDAINKQLNGTFYGTKGNSVGGNFLIKDSSTNVKGIYQATMVKTSK